MLFTWNWRLLKNVNLRVFDTVVLHEFVRMSMRFVVAGARVTVTLEQNRLLIYTFRSGSSFTLIQKSFSVQSIRVWI